MSATEPGTDADLDTLEQEREFLLRSLADLDSEYEAGDIEDYDYRSLTDDYTARAAAVLRAIDANKATTKRASSSGWARPTPSRPATGTSVRAKASPTSSASQRSEPDAARALLSAALQSRRRWRTTAVVIVVLGFGVVAALVVAQSSGSRQPGQTASGNSQLSATTAGGGVDQRLVSAADLDNQGKVADALKLYDAVLHDDPNQPTALAHGGWLQARAGLAGNRADLVNSGLVRIEKAERIAPNFADAHFFRGFLLLRAKNDAPGAVTELRLYLGIVDPSAPQVPQVETLLQEAIKTAGANVPSGPNAPATTAVHHLDAVTSRWWRGGRSSYVPSTGAAGFGESTRCRLRASRPTPCRCR